MTTRFYTRAAGEPIDPSRVDWSAKDVTVTFTMPVSPNWPKAERGIPRISHELMAIQVCWEKLPAWLRGFLTFIAVAAVLLVLYTAYVALMTKAVVWWLD